MNSGCIESSSESCIESIIDTIINSAVESVDTVPKTITEWKKKRTIDLHIFIVLSVIATIVTVIR